MTLTKGHPPTPPQNTINTTTHVPILGHHPRATISMDDLDQRTSPPPPQIQPIQWLMSLSLVITREQWFHWMTLTNGHPPPCNCKHHHDSPPHPWSEPESDGFHRRPWPPDVWCTDWLTPAGCPDWTIHCLADSTHCGPSWTSPHLQPRNRQKWH